MIPPQLFGLVAGLAIFGGLALALDALRPRTPGEKSRPRTPSVLTRLAAILGVAGDAPSTVRQRRMLIAATVVGLVAGIATGWYLLIILLPAIVIGVPFLVRRTPTDDHINKLADLDSWVRSLSGILVGGAAGLEQALRASLGSAPRTIKPSLARLVARLDAQQPIAPSLRLWADEMNDHTADVVAAALILESERREGGISEALNELADNVANQTRARRQIEADRATHRSTARWITIISLVTIGGMVLTGQYIEPYKTPSGQIVALVLLGLYTLCLLWMRKISLGKPIPRFLPPTR